MRILALRDIERFENTSFASVFGFAHAAHSEPLPECYDIGLGNPPTLDMGCGNATWITICGSYEACPITYCRAIEQVTHDLMPSVFVCLADGPTHLLEAVRRQ